MEQQSEQITNNSFETPSNKDNWSSSPKANAIVGDAERLSQSEQQSNQEPLDHHSPADNSQDSIDGDLLPSHDTVIKSADDHASEEGSMVAGDMASDDHEAHEIPEWGKKDPVAYRLYKKRMKEKAKAQEEKRIAELQHQVNQYENLIKSGLNGHSTNETNYQQNDNIVIDPKSGMPIDITTPEGGALLNELRLEAARQQFSGQRTHQEYERIKNIQEQALANQIEEAKYKYKDYEDVVINNGNKFSQQMIDIAAILPDNNADFLYYLAKNHKELDRVRNLNPYEQFKVLIRNAIDFNTKSPKISSAPEPVRPLSKGFSANTDSMGSYESAKALMKKKYCPESSRRK